MLEARQDGSNLLSIDLSRNSLNLFPQTAPGSIVVLTSKSLLVVTIQVSLLNRRIEQVRDGHSYPPVSPMINIGAPSLEDLGH
jgi:hypothetical protein